MTTGLDNARCVGLRWMKMLQPMATYLGELPVHRHPEVIDPLRQAKIDDAIRYLGDRWRGRAECSHKYTRAGEGS